MKKSKILIIAYYFPPRGTVGSLRLYQIARQLGDFFLSVYVISTQTANILIGNDLPFEGMKLKRVRHLDYRSMFFSESESVRSNVNRRSTSLLVQLSRKLLDSFPFNILIGEGGLLYIWNVYRHSVKLIQEEGIEYIMSSFRPFSDHFVAYLLKRKFPDLYWIADFRDLHVDQHRGNTFWPSFQLYINKLLLRKSNLVTTVSKGLHKKLSDLHDDVYVLSNGLSDVMPIKSNKLHDENCLTFTYTGSLYPEYQNVSLFFALLRSYLKSGHIQSNQVRVIYAGKDAEIWDDWIKKHELEAISVNHGLVSLAESIRLQNNSDVNILLSWASEEIQGVVTGKLYEYLKTGKPILLLLNGVGDAELERMFEVLDCGELIKLKAENSKENLTKVLDKWIADPSSLKQYYQNPEALKQMEWPVLVSRFVERIREETDYDKDGDLPVTR